MMQDNVLVIRISQGPSRRANARIEAQSCYDHGIALWSSQPNPAPRASLPFPF